MMREESLAFVQAEIAKITNELLCCSVERYRLIDRLNKAKEMLARIEAGETVNVEDLPLLR